MVPVTENAYAPPRSTVADPASGVAEGQFQLADRGTRFGAAVVDGLLLFGTLAPAYVVVFRGMMTSGKSVTGAVALLTALGHTGLWVTIGGIAFLAVAMTNAVLVHRHGQSIAKRWFGIKVVRKDGSRATLGRIFWLRNFVNGLCGYIPVVGAFYGLVDLLFIFRADRRCCHDFIADTIVVRA